MYDKIRIQSLNFERKFG